MLPSLYTHIYTAICIHLNIYWPALYIYICITLIFVICIYVYVFIYRYIDVYVLYTHAYVYIRVPLSEFETEQVELGADQQKAPETIMTKCDDYIHDI